MRLHICPFSETKLSSIRLCDTIIRRWIFMHWSFSSDVSQSQHLTYSLPLFLYTGWTVKWILTKPFLVVRVMESTNYAKLIAFHTQRILFNAIQKKIERLVCREVQKKFKKTIWSTIQKKVKRMSNAIICNTAQKRIKRRIISNAIQTKTPFWFATTIFQCRDPNVSSIAKTIECLKRWVIFTSNFRTSWNSMSTEYELFINRRWSEVMTRTS